MGASCSTIIVCKPGKLYGKRTKWWKKLFETFFSSDEVYISIWEYHEIKWLINLYESSKIAYESYRKVFQCMKKDYSLLIGKNMRIKRIEEPDARPFQFSKIAEESLKANSKRS